MMPFKPLFFYELTDEIELCQVVNKDGTIMTKVVSRCIVPSGILDVLELAIKEGK
jgi:hypothetical protein